jgi:predicted metal-dependent hydrolase
VPTIRLLGQPIAYTVLVRPRRRHAAIQIDAAGHVTVLIPPDFDPAAVATLLHAKARWILGHVAAGETRREADGWRVWWLGAPIGLELRPAQKTGVTRLPDRLVMTAPEPFTPSRLRAQLHAWMLDEARVYLSPRVTHWVGVTGLHPRALRFGAYRSQWGRCRADGEIALNILLMGAPPTVIDYVICHELVHLRHPHHQRVFWRTVEHHYPAVDDAKAWLRRYGPQLMRVLWEA